MAIEAVADRLTQIHYYQEKNSIKGIFFFLGPPATGKTYMAQMLKDVLGDEYKMKIFDMSAYKSDNQSFGLIGATEGYRSAKAGELTSFVNDHPYSICVFDEIEKANIHIQDIFLSILSRGKSIDEFTQKEVDFSKCIFVFTSNLGQELYSNRSFLDNLSSDYDKAQSIIIETIGREKQAKGGLVLKPEFLSRLSQGELILFNKLSFSSLIKIASKSLKENIYAFYKTFKTRIKIEDEEKLIALLLLSFLPILDARRVKGRLAQKFMDTITDFLIDCSSYEVDINSIEIKLDKSVVSFLDTNLSSNDKDNDNFIHECFRKNQTVEFEKELDLQNDLFTLTFKNPALKKLPKSKDLDGDSGSIVVDIPDVSFEQIAGHEEVKKRLKEIADTLKEQSKIQNFKIQPPKGMLLYGEPGTGKTMLAKAFANMSNLPFISTTGTEILDPSFMKKIFKRAREYAPSIIFIDEIDAIGSRNRNGFDTLINQLLTELNGFSDRLDEQVFVIAATNFKEKIDPAILRSGRIDLHVKVGKLDKKARRYFIDKMLSKPTIGEIDTEKIVTFTAGLSGADLEKISRESSLEAIRQGKDGLSEEIILEEINTLRYGKKNKRKDILSMLKSTAHHEAGHAIASYMLRPHVKIEQITVAPRNNTLGFVSYNTEDESKALSLEDIKNQICVCFAGRIAEIKYAKENGLEAGASSDLQKATNLAYIAISELGMGEELGYINVSSLKNLNGGYISQKIEEEMVNLLKEQKSRCEELVQKQWQTIQKVANELLDKESISENEFLSLVNKEQTIALEK